MDYNALLDLTTELGYRLAMCGAETYRIEESVNRIMTAYGIEAEAFAIPNCLHISLKTADGIPMTRMRRIGYHGNDLDSVEKYSNLSRRICIECPDPKEALQWVRDTGSTLRSYKMPLYLLGNFLGGCGFAVLFGGRLADCICAGICGVIVGLVNSFMDKLKANQFFRIITASFLMSVFAYFSGTFGFIGNPDATIIGALMILVPGLLITNAMRDIIYGDTNSGINRIVHVLLIAAAIALGTAAAWNITAFFLDAPTAAAAVTHPLWLEIVACFIGCVGFFILFNIHGPGGFLCALGGVLTWVCYRLVAHYSGSDFAAYFWATLLASAYAEIMARVRKYPAISYLVISIFPLIPGAGVYYSVSHAVQGDMAAFASRGMHTAAIAGIMAVGILIASTTVRIISDRVQRVRKNQ